VISEREGWGVTGRHADFGPARSAWPEGHAVPRAPRRLARKAALSVALALWFLVVSALGNVVKTPPYSAPASTPSARSTATSTPPYSAPASPPSARVPDQPRPAPPARH
jgi:hypothetical protein